MSRSTASFFAEVSGRWVALLAVAAATLVAAEKLPHGLVESSADGSISIRFDGAAKLTPGTLVAIYGPGRIEKHPLTKQVMIEERKLVAKAQLLRTDAESVSARIVWSGGSTIDKGMDAVPLPGESAPNAPPIAGTPPTPAGAAGSALTLTLPISDPDGDALSVIWEVSGPAGTTGRVETRATGGPTNTVLLPATPGELTVSAAATDQLGQTVHAAAVITVGPPAEVNKRAFRPAIRWGNGAQPALARLVRDRSGVWWGIAASDGQVASYGQGWSLPQPMPWAKENAPERAIALVDRGDELFVLDRKTVKVYRPNGQLLRGIGQLSAPTDLAVTSEGILLVADQGLGGVAVIEPTGKVRGILGRLGEGDDAFAGLIRVVLADSGELFCLDAKQKQIQRFDRFQRRLDTWSVVVQADETPVDIAWSAKGVHVALSSGRVLVFTAKGSAGGTLKRLADTTLGGSSSAKAVDVAVDRAGQALVAYDDGSLIRYAADGSVAGVRGPASYVGKYWCMDGLGRCFALGEDQWVRVYDAEGWLLGRFGGPADSGGGIAKGVAIACLPDGSAVFVADNKRKQVLRFATTSLAEAERAAPVGFGKPGKYNGQFEELASIACDAAGRLYALDTEQYKVSIFDSGANFLYSVGQRGKTPADLREPLLIAVAPDGGTLYVYDADKYEIKKFQLDQAGAKGQHQTNTGGKGDAAGQIRELAAMGCDRQGLIYLADSSRRDVQVIDFRGPSGNGLHQRKAADAGLGTIEAAAISPDGQVRVIGDGAIAELRW